MKTHSAPKCLLLPTNTRIFGIRGDGASLAPLGGQTVHFQHFMAEETAEGFDVTLAGVSFDRQAQAYVLRPEIAFVPKFRGDKVFEVVVCVVRSTADSNGGLRMNCMPAGAEDARNLKSMLAHVRARFHAPAPAPASHVCDGQGHRSESVQAP